MAGLVPAIHVFTHRSKSWMPGTRPGMTKESSRPLHIAHRKTGDPFVILTQRAQLVLRDEVVEIVERLVAGKLLNLDVDEIRRVFPVGAHDLARGRAPRRLGGGGGGGGVGVPL